MANTRMFTCCLLACLMMLLSGYGFASVLDVDLEGDAVRVTKVKIVVKKGALNGKTVTIKDKYGNTIETGKVVSGKADIDVGLIPKKDGVKIEIDGETWPLIVSDVKNHTSDQQAKAKEDNGGDGTADPPLGPPPSPFVFSPSTFPSGLNFQKFFTTSGGSLVEAVLNDFSGVIEFTPTIEPDQYQASFTAFDFRYDPFGVPGVSGFFAREVLNASVPLSGILDLLAGELVVPVNTLWLDSAGNKLGKSYTLYDVTISATADPNLVDIVMSSEGTLTVPEPSVAVLLGLGLAAMGASRARRSSTAQA